MSEIAPVRIDWIVIPAPAINLAVEFYEKAFGFKISEFREGFFLFEIENLHGALDQDLVPSMNSLSFSLTVPSIDETIERITEYGGEILLEKYELGPNAGYCAKFRDPNGNELELYEPRPGLADAAD